MTVKAALVDSFSRVSAQLAESICQKAGVKPNKRAPDVLGEEVERLHKALGEVKVMAPPATCIVPIGEELIVAGLKRRYIGGEYFSATRPPSVYRGNPFVVECGIAYGGDLPLDEPAEVHALRQPRAAASTSPKRAPSARRCTSSTGRTTGSRSRAGRSRSAPMAIFVHLASVWVPFTSEAKEAVAHYPELLREITLALQECGRKLAQHLAGASARRERGRSARACSSATSPSWGTAWARSPAVTDDEIEKTFYRGAPELREPRRDYAARRRGGRGPARR